MQTSNLLKNQGLNNNLNGFDNKNNDVMVFAEILCELSRYNSDLKAILENSKLSADQNQNENSRTNPYAPNTNNIQSPSLNNVGSVVPQTITEIKTIGGPYEKGNDRNTNNTDGNQINISGNNPVTAGSIYDLLTSQYVIIVDVSKLPKSLKQIVNKLTNNNDLNNPNLNMDSNNQNNKESVALHASQFQDLIYYFIIDAVAKENCMTVTNNLDHREAFSTARQAITEQCQKLSTESNYSRIESINKYAPDNIDQTVSDLKNNVENDELQRIIKDNVENKNESSGFWVQFLCSVLKRASFVYSLCQFFACRQKSKCFDTLKEADIDKRKFMDNQKLESDRKNHLIDTFLSIPQILLLLSLIFGFGAIANVILGLIILATLICKSINQYPKQKQKFFIYKLLQSDHFNNLVKKNGFALIPEVAKIYQYGEKTKENMEQMAKNKLNWINRNTFGYVPVKTQEQYPSLAQLNQFGAQSQGYQQNPFYNQNPDLK